MVKIGIPKEQNDTRVALAPAILPKLKALGVEFLIEKGAGDKAFFSDADYAEHATVTTRDSVLSQADLIISVLPLSTAEYQALKQGTAVISQFRPYIDPEMTPMLKSAGLQAYSLDMIPRTTLAQSMDVLSSMAGIAGYKAVLMAALHLPRFFPMMITAAGTIRPAKVLILGAGVAGLQAIGSARRLGAVVEVFDTRQAVKEEVESLGAKFVEVEGAADDKGAGGYAVQQSEDFLQRQRLAIQQAAAKADVIIATAQVRGAKAPLLITAETIEMMRPGSVIVDLAASTGGNCAFTENNKTIRHNGVTIIGDSELSMLMSQDASVLFGNNLLNYLKLLIKNGEWAPEAENEIVKGSRIA